MAQGSILKFSARFVLFLLMQIPLFALALWPLKSERIGDFFRSLTIKEQRLHESRPPRLIIIGGSNTPYGFESETIANETPYDPVNLGLHFGFGLEFQLDYVDGLLDEIETSPNDLVLMALEYNYFRDGDGRLAIVVYDAVYVHPELIQYLDFSYWKMFLDQAHVFLGARLRTAFQLYREGDDADIGGEEYLNRFNKYGDIMRQYRPTRVVDLGYLSVGATPQSINATIDRLNRFAKEMHERHGVQVALTHPTVPHEALLESGMKELRLIDTMLQQNAEFPIIDAMEEMFLSEDYFHDTVYHLNQKGSPIRTEKVVKGLNAYWEKQGISGGDRTD